MDARTRESNLLYRYLQVENVGIFNFTDQNKTLKNCTIIRDLPCYSNCTVGVKSCDAWDPYMLECGHPGSFFVSSGSFGSWLSQTLRDKNPVPYSSPLDIRLRNGPNSSAATLDAYIASCMYYLREDNDIAFKLFLVIMGTVLAFAWDCVVLINCSTSTLGKGCDRQKALEEEMDSLFSRWLKKTSHAAEYQKLIPYLESESKVQDVADETTMIKAIQKGRDEILTENDNNWKANHGIKIITAEEVKEEKEVKVEEVKVEEVKVEEVKEEKEVLLTAAYALFFKKPEKPESTEVVAPKKSGFCNIL
jgi:hypothetical protein